MVDLKKIFKGVSENKEIGKEHFDKGHDDAEAIVIEDKEHIEQAKVDVEEIIDKSKDETFIDKVK